jgi:hypothetical protein
MWAKANSDARWLALPVLAPDFIHSFALRHGIMKTGLANRYQGLSARDRTIDLQEGARVQEKGVQETACHATEIVLY